MQQHFINRFIDIKKIIPQSKQAAFASEYFNWLTQFSIQKQVK